MHSITWTARRLKEAKLRDNHGMQLELHKGSYCIDFSSIPALFWKGTFPRQPSADGWHYWSVSGAPSGAGHSCSVIIFPWLASWINVPENHIMQIHLTP